MDIVGLDAAALSRAIHAREVSCVEVITAYLDHIDALNPTVNAIVLRRPRAELLAEASARDAELTAGRSRGWMHGFPHAVKDLADVAGIPTTAGFFRSPPPAAADTLYVERLRAAGPIFIGKTNTPEFGLGSNTYNNVHGTTGNAYDPNRTAGGSSGGAAVAVALRMLPVADGSDFMGSLRNPPGWNNVFGLRPSFGRVPSTGDEVFFHQGSVEGPIARTAADLGLLLQTMSGADARAPLSIAAPLSVDPVRPAAGPLGARVAWLGDLGGYLPMEPAVLQTTTAALAHFEALGMSVTTLAALPAAPNFRGVEDLWPTWLTYRHFLAGGGLRPLYDVPAYRAALKPEVLFEVEGFLPLTAADIHRAALARTGLYHAFRALFETYDYVVLPTAQVMPFDAATHWPASIEGVPMSTYHRWMEVVTIGTLLGAPVLAMPAGFADGLPIGLQVIGRHQDDASLLALAAAWEQQTRFAADHRPPLLGA